MKLNSKLILLLIILVTVVVGGYLLVKGKRAITTDKTDQLIGGQKDAHGCLIGAGYSWCEAKTKCLRVWEEKCVIEPVEPNKIVETTDTLTYTNDTYKFKLTLPAEWKDYRATEGIYRAYTSVSLSFGAPHQPFSITSILIYTPGQWEKVPNKTGMKLLGELDGNKYVCDGCCFEVGDFLGGGQFDAFQQARCQETAKIMESFTFTQE
jgi:hypothetical protein